MKKEIAEKWVAALRSGQYAQTTGTLRSADQFCCLGVLCDLYAKEKQVPWGKPAPDLRMWEFLGETDILPVAVQAWAGIDSADGYLPKEDYVLKDQDLATYNDDGMTFSEIADVIEEYRADL